MPAESTKNDDTAALKYMGFKRRKPPSCADESPPAERPHIVRKGHRVDQNSPEPQLQPCKPFRSGHATPPPPAFESAPGIRAISLIFHGYNVGRSWLEYIPVNNQGQLLTLTNCHF